MAYHLDKFIPANVITGMTLKKLQNELVFKGLVDYKYQDGLKKGKSIRIPGISNVTIDDYDGTDITIQDVADVSVELEINQAKYFAMYVDKVDDYQSAMEVLPLFVDEGAYKLSASVDTFIATDITAKSSVITGGTVDSANVADWVASIKVQMDKNKVRQAGRWLVVTPEIAGVIAVSNIFNASTTSEEARKSGFMTRFLGFDIYMSNALITNQCLAGVGNAYTFVQSLGLIDFDNSEKRFASIAKSLLVYGGRATLGTDNPNGDVALFKSTVTV